MKLTPEQAASVNAKTDSYAVVVVVIASLLMALGTGWVLAQKQPLDPVAIEQCAQACIATKTVMLAWENYRCVCELPQTKGPTP